MTLLEVQNLQIQVKTGPVIRNVSFSLNEGERLGIVGESGSGKTVLMRSIMQLLPSSMTLSGGTIHYQDRLLSSLTDREMQKVRGKEIAMVFQDPMTFLNPTQKIGAQIAEGYRRHFPKTTKSEAAEKALELLKQVGVAEPELRLTQYPHLLSGGLRQRVLIALALVAEPSLLIADEPTTALDTTIQAQIMQLLSTLQKNKTTILVSHDLSLVASFCDRVIVMYAGQIVEDAPIDELFAAPAHPYTEQLLKSIPTFASRTLAAIPGSPPDLSTPIKGCAFAPRCPYVHSQCREEEPPLFTTGVRHKSLCWLKQPVKNK